MEIKDEIKYKEQALPTEKKTIIEEYNLEKIEKRKNKLKWIILLIVIIAIILILISLLLWYFLSFKTKKEIFNAEKEEQEEKDEKEEKEGIEEKEEEKEIQNEKILDKDIQNYEKELKAFEPNFKIKNKPDILTYKLMESSEIYNSKYSGIESSYSIFTKAKYDLYTLNETSPMMNIFMRQNIRQLYLLIVYV